MKEYLWISGIVTALFGAFVMWHGSLFGENNTAIAIIIGIIGIALIATNSPCHHGEKRKNGKTKNK